MESAYVRRPQWSWAGEAVGSEPQQHENPGESEESTSDKAHAPADASSNSEPHPHDDATTPPQPAGRQRHYKPRTCRICLDVVEPTTEMDESASSLPASIFRAKPRVRYVSDDPSLGRLISPCKCKGSQKYVHEGCLQAWRQASPLSDRNFWRCPTCAFEYRLERLRWGRWISSRWTRGVLTAGIFVLSLFVLGFVADPIINLWLDPLGSFASSLLTEVDVGDVFREELRPEDPNTWSFHFLKGILSMGLLGFVKTFFTLIPWQWTVHRYVGGRRRGNGRNRLEDINWGLVVIGVITFLAAVWKVISHVSARALEKASENMVDVQGSDEPDEDDEEPPDDNDHAADESKKEQ